MLRKLLKYDFRKLINKLGLFYLVALGLGILNRIATVLADEFPILDLPSGLIMGLTVVVLIAVPIATFIVALRDYYTSLTKDEGYLIHTLPVKKSDIVLSKLISYLVMQFVSIVIALAIVPLAFDIPGTFYTTLFDAIKELDATYIILMILSVVTSGILSILLVYAAIALGQKHNENRIGYSFASGIILYMVNQLVSVIILAIPMVFDRKLLDYFTSEIDTLPISSMYVYLGISVVASIGLSVGYFLLTTKTYEKKLNLE